MDGGILEPSLYMVKAVAILDNDGNRLVTKYYDDQFPTSKEQKAFEKNLFNKTHKANSEIIMFEGLTCVYRSNVDLFFYVVGSSQENELILASVLNALYESVTVDEICDGGIILDSDATSIVQKVSLRTDDLNIGEQTMAQHLSKKLEVLQSAKEQIKWSLLK
ncbi:COPZ [Mytilus edulis]|uniref:Coatomer subunit zeta n=1 Tax=Mytilus edulis TaxID=6550 RepID=A0A8S3R7V4_MYTED|nr:COPZ [Mytilus edulis]